MPDEYSIDQYMPRNNQDKQVNQNGRLLLDFLRSTRLAK